MVRIELFGGIALCLAGLIFFGYYLISGFSYMLENLPMMAFMLLMFIGILLIMVAMIGRLLKEGRKSKTGPKKGKWARS